METKIKEKLKEVSTSKNIEVLFAVESGSRAWGFASPDSDYDIRFVYKHKTSWYLNLWEQKDSIEFMTKDDLDGAGWDIRKALKLLAKSNASFIDWLFSPIVYAANEDFLNELRTLAKITFNPVAGFHHYHSMSKRFEETLANENLILKSFFYALRTALCAKWILKNETIPPVAFKELLVLVAIEYHSEIEELIQIKHKSKEKDNTIVSKKLIVLVKDIINENHRLKNSLPNIKSEAKLFNELFLKTIS